MKEITVYYASPDNLNQTEDWSILYKEPVSLSSLLNKNINKNRNKELGNRAYLSCTAYQNISKNLYVLENPIESSYKIINNVALSTGKNSLSATIKREPQLNNQILLEYSYPIILFSDESLEVQFTAPYFINAPHIQYGSVTPGQYNIGKWFRPIQIEFNLWSNVDEFVIKQDEPLAFINFLTDKKIKFKMFEMSNELAKIMNVCSTASSWESNVPLVNRYVRFHESKMLNKTLAKIKERIIE